MDYGGAPPCAAKNGAHGGKHGTGAGKLISPGTRMPQGALVVLINWHRMAPRRSCGELLELKRGT